MEPKSTTSNNNLKNTSSNQDPDPNELSADLDRMEILEDNRYGSGEYTLFERVLAAANRAKDIHNEGRIPLVKTFFNNAPTIALAELKLEKIVVDKPDPEQSEAETNPKIKSATSIAPKNPFSRK